MSNIYTIRTNKKKSDPDEFRDPRCRHLEEWRRQSEESRNKVLGENLFNESEDLYSLRGVAQDTPSFRPKVSIPEMQKIILEDSNRITDISPMIYIFGKGQEAEKRESALQALYQMANVNYHMLYGTLMSRYLGTGFIQLSFSPDMRNGRGGMWVKSRHPASVGLDPTTDYEFDPTYLYYDDWMHIEEIKKRWPATSQHIKFNDAPSQTSSLISGTGYGFQMPSGPMQTMPGMPGQNYQGISSSIDNRVRVSHYFCKDYTRQMIDKKDIPDGALTDPEFKWKYPNGRMLVECNGYILADGPNPFPHRTDIPSPFLGGIFPVWAIPPIFNGPWGIPITRFSKTLQDMSEKLYTQIYENLIRLNNGVWFIDSNTGIDIEAFGGMPGEVQMINPNTRVPEMVSPQALPSNAISFPDALLNKQKSLLGQTESKEGKPGMGNVSTSLFEASVLQSSGMLQVAGRLQSFTIGQLATCMFFTAGRYIDRQNLPLRGDKKMEMIEWEGLLDPHDYDLILDEDSLQPLSEMALRRMVPDLMKTGILGTERGLQLLGVPHAERIAQEQKENLELQALAGVKGKKK